LHIISKTSSDHNQILFIRESTYAHYLK